MSIPLTDLIKEQSYECLIMFCSGIAFMLVWQICSCISKRLEIKTWMRIGLEIAFWLIIAVMISEFLFYCAYGKISVHSIIALGMGILLWKHCFYDIMAQCNNRQIKGLRKRYGKEKKKQSVQGQQSDHRY